MSWKSLGVMEWDHTMTRSTRLVVAMVILLALPPEVPPFTAGAFGPTEALAQDRSTSAQTRSFSRNPDVLLHPCTQEHSCQGHASGFAKPRH